MPDHPKTATADVLTPEQALAELLALDMDSRRTAVAKDVRSRSPRYRCIPALELPRFHGRFPVWNSNRDGGLHEVSRCRVIHSRCGAAIAGGGCG